MLFINMINKKATKALDVFVILLMALLLIMIFFQVLNRFILHIPAAWTEELGRYNFVWLSLFGSVKALRSRTHLSVEILVDRLNPKHKSITSMIAYIIMSIFFIILIKTGFDYTVANIGVNCEFGAFPISVIYAALPIAGLLLFVSSLEGLFEEVKKLSLMNAKEERRISK